MDAPTPHRIQNLSNTPNHPLSYTPTIGFILSDDPAPPPPHARAHWTPAKQRIFLTALVETGSIARAARAAGMSRSSPHALRNRLTGTPFDHA